MRDGLWLVERLIIWSVQEHCRCCAYLIRVPTAGQKKEDLENVPKVSLYVSRCYYPWRRIVTYPEWLLLLIISILWMGHQLLRNAHVQYLIEESLVKSGNVHLDALCLLDKWPNQIYLPIVIAAQGLSEYSVIVRNWRQANTWSFFSVDTRSEVRIKTKLKFLRWQMTKRCGVSVSCWV